MQSTFGVGALLAKEFRGHKFEVYTLDEGTHGLQFTHRMSDGLQRPVALLQSACHPVPFKSVPTKDYALNLNVNESTLLALRRQFVDDGVNPETHVSSAVIVGETSECSFHAVSNGQAYLLASAPTQSVTIGTNHTSTDSPACLKVRPPSTHPRTSESLFVERGTLHVVDDIVTQSGVRCDFVNMNGGEMRGRTIQESNPTGGPTFPQKQVVSTPGGLHVEGGQDAGLYIGGSATHIPTWRVTEVNGDLVFQKRVGGTTTGPPRYETKFVIDSNE